ncbi:MAG: putative Extracellular solute-binding protein family 5 [Candidatus Saccharibacteria bacterium]|nr:putative Extracellular solute-binding protein family 5 [Candidatus Saccharibacteria bacterium]
MKKVEGATVRHARRFVFKRMDSIREVRRHIILWVLTIGLIIGASGLQLMWYQQSYRSTANANNGTYAEAVLGPVNTLNPIFASTSAEESASYLLFSRLLTYDQTGHLNYDLAQSMVISTDQKTYTIKLRPDAKWQDGVYVRAKDVVYTVNLLKNPATRATITGWNTITATAVDDLTVQFTLPDVYAAFPHALNFLPILPEHILRDVAPSEMRQNAFSTSPMGSGPFTLRFIQAIDTSTGRSIIHLARNDAYYRGAPKLERFQLHIYATSDAIIHAVATSEVNAATDLSVSDVSKITSDRYVVERKPINAGVYALFNTTVGVMSDKTVRQALQMGTDTAAVRSVVGKNTPEIHLPFVTGQVTGDVPSEVVYNKAGAEALLDQAGWKLDGTVRKKDGNLLRLTVVTTKNNDFEKALSNMAEQWRGLGVTVTTSIVDPTDPSQNVVQNILQPRAYDVLMYQLTIGGDPDVYAYWHSSQASKGFNFSNYSNPISDDALASARIRIEPNLRNAKYVTFAKQWMADAPAIGLFQATMQYVHSTNVHAMPGDEVLVSAADRYADVLYWTVGDRLVQQTP